MRGMRVAGRFARHNHQPNGFHPKQFKVQGSKFKVQG
jgi:hypothetical protein